MENTDEPIEIEPEEAIEARFSVSSDEYVSADSISEMLQLVPSLSHTKGEKYKSKRGDEGIRYRTVWHLSSRPDCQSKRVEDHLSTVLVKLENSQEGIRRLLNDSTYGVSIQIWIESTSTSMGIDVSSSLLRRASLVCEDMRFHFVCVDDVDIRV